MGIELTGSDLRQIKDKLFEVQARIDLAKHYGIPYPRLAYVNPESTGKVSREGEGGAVSRWG